MFDVLFVVVFSIGFVLLLAGVILANILWRAWWLYPAWTWFVVPIGAPAITFWHFTGLMLLLSIVTHQIDTKEDERKEAWTSWIVGYTWPVVAWVVLRWLS